MKFSCHRLIPAICLLLLCACSGENAQKKGATAIPVHVDIVEQKSIPRILNVVGNVRSSASVGVTPRVTGEIQKIHFHEGQHVNEGDPLVSLDPRPFEASLREKEGLLAKSKAQLNKANDDMRRYGKLVNGGYVSREAYEQAATEAAALTATLQAEQAAVENAALELSYCTVIAPISGRVGALKVDKGNMIRPSDSSPIVAIDTISPIYVNFSVPEIHLATILHHMEEGPVAITATPTGGQAESGQLTLVDNSVDIRTGTIRLRGTFKNEKHRLWPGQFVEVSLPLGTVENAIIIPSKAVQAGRDESYVYVVDADNRAAYRKVTVLFEYQDKSIVESKISQGDKIVTDGHVRLVPDALLNILN